MISVLDEGCKFTSLQQFIMSSAVAMDILCITNIGSISSENTSGVKKIPVKCQIVICFVQISRNI